MTSENALIHWICWSSGLYTL